MIDYWNYCSSCCRRTKHFVLFKKEILDSNSTSQIGFDDDDDDPTGKNVFLVLECNGCEQVSFRKDRYQFTCGVVPDESLITTEIFPSNPAFKGELISSSQLPVKIADVYEQTILALNGGSKLLAGAGFRAIIEAVCIERNIKGYGLDQKINNLCKNKLITQREADRLHSIRFLGNDAIHEMTIPAEATLVFVLDVVEHLLKNLYVLDRHAKYFLDTIITDYSDFEVLVNQRLLFNYKEGDEVTLDEILGKNKRRLPDGFVMFEAELINRIRSGHIDHLKVHQNEGLPNQSYIIGNLDKVLPF